MTAAPNSTTRFSITHSSSKSLSAKWGKHGACCSLNVNGCGGRINGGGGGPDMAAVRICQTRTLPAVAAPETALRELKLAVAALNDNPPCFESGIIRLQVPIQQRADAIDWLHSQQNRPCCYFSSRGQKHDFSLFEEKESSDSSLKEQKLISTAGVGSAVFFQRFDKFALQDWRCIKRFLSSTSPLIRAYGGIRFDSNAPISSEWKDFGSFYFIIPQVELNELEESSMLAATIAWDTTFLRTWDNAMDALQKTMHKISPYFTKSRKTFPRTSILSCSHIPSKASWDISVNKALEMIMRKDCNLAKVVLARCSNLVMDTDIDPLTMLACLQMEGQDAYQFYIQPPDSPAFIGNTPEQLFHRKFLNISSEALAGTRGRGLNKDTDFQIGQDLLNSPKDDIEFTIVRESIRRKMKTICSGLVVDPVKTLRKLPRVQHLSAILSGNLRREADEFDILSSLHPTPAVCGLPTEEARKFITDNEIFDRGMYAGPVGWFGGSESEFAVGIRSALVGKGFSALVYAGAGIVKGTDPSLEWEELNLKASQFTKLLQYQDLPTSYQGVTNLNTAKCPNTVRKLAVEVIDARDLIPKDGQGTSSPYVVVEFDGQRKRTRTIPRDLNPQWNEQLEFVVSDPSNMEDEELDIEVYNDKRMGSAPGGARKNHFLGRIKIYGSQFARRGEEGLIYFPLEKKNLLTWIRGELGLKIYYYDEEVEEKRPEEEQQEEKRPENQPPPDHHLPAPTEAAVETQAQNPPPVHVVVVEEAPPPVITVEMTPPQPEENPRPPHPDPYPYPPELRKMQTFTNERITRVNSDRPPRVLSGRFSSGDPVDRVQTAYDLVEPMQYLFIRVVKARNIRPSESPFVKIRSGPHTMRSRPARDGSGNPEWNQLFALNQSKPESTLEISVWDGGPNEMFLGGVCFDLSDVPVRDNPDGPLAPQWYRLEGGDENGNVTGDLMVAVWFGTQSDESFPESMNSDAPFVSYTRSKVYQSPKLWYLRASVVEAQDLHVPSMTPGTPLDIRVKIQLGFQSARTRRSIANGTNSTFSWFEDLMFVVSEPLDEQVVVLVEDRTSIKDPALIGHALIPVNSIEQRLDERQIVAPKWFNLEGMGGGGGEGGGPGAPQGLPGPCEYTGRVHLRLCLEGGYHVLDEAAHVCSDFRPTAKQLWQPSIGVLELGILGARGLLPMKTKGGAKGSTDAYCVAKYGKKWVRTRTIMDNFDPRWNEQYTWQVYDPCTVLTIGVFDNWRMFADMAGEDRPDYRIGKVRIRVSTLESNRVYTNAYPLLVLLKSGVKKMGEIQVAIRFACPALLPDTCAIYSHPMLPRMHYLRPIGVAHQEVLRNAAIKMVAGWLARSEPPLGPEVVRYMLDADTHTWSMRRSKANWFRIMGVLAWAVGLARWINDIRRWRNPVTTVLVHMLYLVLVWYPELVVPTTSLYIFLIGSWYYRFRPKAPSGMDMRLSQADMVDPDELDEEFDPIPSTKPHEVIRARYDRLRVLAGRVQTVMGDLAAQGERVQALVTWRDPRATRLFIGVCLIVAILLYVVPPKMVAVALGFYFLRHPMFRDPMPSTSLNFFRRLPSLSDRLL